MVQAAPMFALASGPPAAGGPLIQKLDPVHSTLGGTLVALIPIVLLLVLLAVLRMSAWQAVIIGAAVTIILAITVWGAPVGTTFGAWASIRPPSTSGPRRRGDRRGRRGAGAATGAV